MTSASADLAILQGVPGLTGSAELESLPMCVELCDVDLSLGDRDRVSALPWRGQFSPLTVARLLDALVGEVDLILDPFLGSGTVLLEAARRGHAAWGIDVNPAAVALSRCACLASLPKAERLDVVQAAKEMAFGDNSTERLSQEPIGIAHALAILADKMNSEEAALARVAELVGDLPEDQVDIQAFVGDARATGLGDESVSAILTSPPYINVFNYHQYGRPLTDGFAWPVLRAARSEIGSNRQNRGNRFRTVVQYSLDMALALAEMSRIMNAGGTAILVVGRESRVRGISFFNSDLIARIARDLGCFASRSRAERQFVNRYGDVIYEDILVLSNSSPSKSEQPAIEQIGRSHGLEALAEASARAGGHVEIEAAIGAAAEIDPSPLAGAAG
ncbi:MAG TPA: DNA methyltransferase [Solirubrobacterales bacterium]|nr:DNA methyltransferase [Solirubrobacterales bacterium]